MKTEKKYIITGITLLLSLIPNFFLIGYISDNFDYCVTHGCGVTHNFGIQDAIWVLYPLGSTIFIIIISLMFFSLALTEKKEQI